MDIVALILMIIGALNWGLIGLFQFDLVAAIFGGSASVISRIIYSLVGLAGIWGITMLFRRGSQTSSPARGPGDLQIESTGIGVYIDDFSCEV